jgi:hypothetical protein
MPHEPDPLYLLRRAPDAEWTPEEIKRFTEELSIAYHTDEATSTSRDVQRISEKVRLRLDQQTYPEHTLTNPILKPFPEIN